MPGGHQVHRLTSQFMKMLSVARSAFVEFWSWTIVVSQKPESHNFRSGNWELLPLLMVTRRVQGFYTSERAGSKLQLLPIQCAGKGRKSVETPPLSAHKPRQQQKVTLVACLLETCRNFLLRCHAICVVAVVGGDVQLDTRTGLANCERRFGAVVRTLEIIMAIRAFRLTSEFLRL